MEGKLVPFPDYSVTDTMDGTLDERLLHDQIAADPAIVTGLDGVTRTGDSFVVSFVAPPSPQERAACDSVVAAHSSLVAVQDRLVDQIKAHRDGYRLFVLLAEHPAGSGNMFSCCAASQDNWAKLATLDAQGAVTYPYEVTTHNERGSYSLVDTADREAATLAIASVVLGERGLAAGYIGAVLDATTPADATDAAAPYLAM